VLRLWLSAPLKGCRSLCRRGKTWGGEQEEIWEGTENKGRGRMRRHRKEVERESENSESEGDSLRMNGE